MGTGGGTADRDVATAALAEAIADAGDAVAFTGAGVSTPSGVPDFRGDGGLWERFDPATFTRDAFDREPEGFWRTWRDVRDAIGVDDVAPNPAHEALTELVRDGALDAVVTQNADGLHQAARTGEDAVIEIHGNARRALSRLRPAVPGRRDRPRRRAPAVARVRRRAGTRRRALR